MIRLMRRVILLWLLLYPLAAFPDSYGLPTLWQDVQFAAFIGTVKIISRKPVTAPGRPEVLCGYINTAQVIHAIKSDENEFSFFSRDRGDFVGLDKIYFLIAYRRHFQPLRESNGKVFRFFESSEKAVCNAVPIDYFAGNGRQTLFPFYVEKNKNGNREWLLTNRLSPFSYSNVYRHEKICMNGRQYDAVAWSDVRKRAIEIKQKLVLTPPY